jgi:uncharacterized membrane protein YhaH (DUF805 family)
MGIVADWFSFGGRITRQHYWLRYVLLTFAIELAIVIVSVLANRSDFIDFVNARSGGPVGHAGGTGMRFGAGGGVEAVLSIAMWIGALAGATKRLHDRDRSGWFQFIVFVPLIGAIWLFLETAFLRGTPGPNRFGPDPLARQGY